MMPTVSRRTLLAGTGSTALALALSRRAAAMLPGSRPIALLDGLLVTDEAAAAREILSALEVRVLQPDLVSEWRRGLQSAIERAGAIAVTHWDKAILFRQLAREHGLQVRQTRVAHSLFVTELTGRTA